MQNVTLNVGDKLTWVDAESSFVGRDVQSYSGEWRSPILTNQGASFSYTFDRPGTFIYRSYRYVTDDFTNYRTDCCVVVPGTVTVLPWTNAPPAVTINHPIEGVHFIASVLTLIPLLASVTNSPTNVVRVEFFAGTNWLGAVSNEPYRLIVNITNAGDYALTAQVTEMAGLQYSSPPVNILVRPKYTIEVYRPRRLPNGVFLMDYAACREPYPRICILSSEDPQSLNQWSAWIFTTFGTFADELATNAPLRFYSIFQCE